MQQLACKAEELEFEWKITIFLQTRPVIMCFFEEELVDLQGQSFFLPSGFKLTDLGCFGSCF